MKAQNQLWGSSAEVNYPILVKSTTNEIHSQLLSMFVSELFIQLTILHFIFCFQFSCLTVVSFFLINIPVFLSQAICTFLRSPVLIAYVIPHKPFKRDCPFLFGFNRDEHQLQFLLYFRNTSHFIEGSQQHRETHSSLVDVAFLRGGVCLLG